MSECKARALNPDKIEFKLEITFTLAEWREIRENLKSNWQYPTRELADSISDCITQAEQSFIPRAIKPGD
ncbi:MAG: hypothetical protein N0C84_16895 [Candidatus Thiodiazotropha taylori]|uniref:Uncharacterized protein n=1 Tax=Candidatus Thiodiazotropha taylori TaxID=2792791 RepID=A0A9E4N5T1_9GAMM|nr:hypothetical protein [Candidatus Thiodiazotropha taylori]MCW4258144.1 hypothetical protein [Candidatus Thiodiazotropha taylori]